MKKKLTGIILLLIIMIGVTAAFAHGTKAYASGEWFEIYDDNGGVLTYAVENDEATIIDYYFSEEVDAEYQIPSYIEGYKVTTIGESAFYDSEYEKIIIPDTVKTIESYALGGNYAKLKELIIPDSVTTLCENAISASPYLEKVVIGNGVKVIPKNLLGGEVLKSITLGKNVEEIGEGAFSWCTSLESIVLPPKLKTIGESAFLGCTLLKNIEIPSTTETIGSGAFAECTALQSITIPDSVTSLGEFAFGRCTSLETAVIGNGLKEIPLAAFQEATMLRKVTLGKNIEMIDEQAFMECNALKEINLPDKLKSIKRIAFWRCESLESITTPASMESIGENAFYGCIGLKTLSLNDGLTEIGTYAFGETTSLKDVTIPGTLKTIQRAVFQRSGIESIIFCDGIERIEDEAFAGCLNLKSVNIPDSVTYIGSSCFSYNESLRAVQLGDGLEEICSSTFAGCGVKSVSFGENLKTIGSNAFSDCIALETLELNEGLETIASSAFSECRGLREITIPDTVTEIGHWAFANCNSMTEITIPNSVTQILEKTFYNCYALENINIGLSVESIGEYVFAGCKKLKEIYIPCNVTKISYDALQDSGIEDVIYAGSESQWQKVENYKSIEYYATVHFGRKTEKVSTVSTKRENIHHQLSTVYKNLNDMSNPKDNYVICTDAKISFDGKEYSADERGIVPMPYSGEIVVSAPGYRTEVMGYVDYMNGLGIFLEKETDLPIIKSVKLGKNEIRRSSQKFFKSKSDSFKAVVDFNGHQDCEVYIENGDNKWNIGPGGTSGKVEIGKEFNRWNGSRIVVEMPDGRQVYKWLDMGYAPEVNTKPQVSFGDSISDLGSDTIRYLDTIKFDFSIPNFPFDVTISGEKVIATIGVDVTKWSYSGEKGEWDNQYNAHKTLAEVLKNSYERMADKKSAAEEYEDLLKDIGNAKKKGLKSKFGFDANVTALGYLEGTITDKGVYFSDGGMIIAVKGSAGFSGQGIVVVGPTPVPYNWEAKLKGELEAKLQVAQREDYGEELTPQGTLGISLGLEVDAGPGIPNAHINLGVEGSLDPLFIFRYDSRETIVDANVGLFIEAAIGTVEYKDNLAKKTFNLYPKPEKKSAEIGLFSASEYKLIDRDYLEQPREFVANNGISMLSVGESNETVLKTNTFKVSDPQMADLGSGKRIVVWVDDDVDADAVNGRTIMYTYYDGSAWSDEKFVDKNGMSAFNPQIKKVGTNVYLAWESVDAVLSDTFTLEDMLKNTEIKYAVFDEASGSFVNITKLTDNEYTDSNPVISDASGTAVITWVQNSANDILTANSNNSLNYAVVDGSTVIRTELAADGLSSVESHIATGYIDYIDVMYISDTDGDLMTTADNELFSSRSGQLTDDDNVKSGLCAFDGTYYFYNGGTLSIYSYGETIDTGITLPNDEFVICGQDKTVVFLKRNGASSEVYAYFREAYEDKYGEAVQLTDIGEYYLEDLSCYKNTNGEFVLAFNKRHITGDFEENISSLYGQSDLSTVIVSPYNDITLDHVYADLKNIVPGYDTVIEADITNNGCRELSSVNIALYDADENLLVSSDEKVALLPGESGTVKLAYLVPDDFCGLDGVVVISLDEERNTADNSSEISLKCRDISVDNLRYAMNENGTYTIYAEVVNGSLTDEQGIVIKLVNNETVLEEKTINSLGKFEGRILTFENLSPDNTYSVVAEPLENETMLGNNDEFITIAQVDGGSGYELDGITFKTDGEEMRIAADVSADEAKTENLMLIVAFYNRQQKLVSSKAIPVNFNNETTKSVTDSMAVCDFYKAKVMLWDASLEPLIAVEN